ncbi:hypothetical protein V2J94_04890 [Streptomyces sp. DSM 41524]|uniref:Uncharacterized protein n=1 Tax=Streptomyces asiaticus subsp. ignotus TaxID=3098222 RepID=A0ABU7PQ52_9ACTN|nr:hypothetical protein [Streptomyces sp. DSM 41524]
MAEQPDTARAGLLAEPAQRLLADVESAVPVLDQPVHVGAGLVLGDPAGADEIPLVVAAVRVLPLARGVVLVRHQDRSAPGATDPLQPLRQPGRPLRAADVQPVQDPVVHQAVVATARHGSADPPRVLQGAAHPAPAALLERRAVVRRGDTGRAQLALEGQQRAFQGQFGPGARQQLLLRTVAVHIHQTGQTQHPLAVDVGLHTARVRCDLRDPAVPDRDQRVVQHPVRQHRPYVPQHVVPGRAAQRPALGRWSHSHREL